MADFLAWAIALLQITVQWLASMSLSPGVSLLAFLAATFVLGLLIRALVVRA